MLDKSIKGIISLTTNIFFQRLGAWANIATLGVSMVSSSIFCVLWERAVVHYLHCWQVIFLVYSLQYFACVVC